jgi:hypothetical protein
MSVSKQSPFVRACVAFLLALLLSVVVLALALGTHLEG